PPRPLEVVVDALRPPDDADGKPAPQDLAGERRRAAETAVAPDHEEELHVEAEERIDHPIEILRPARRAERRPATLVHVLDDVWEELRRLVVIRVGEARVAVAEAVDAADAVGGREGQHDRAHDVVEPPAEAAAGEGAAGARFPV